jgi:molybdopterin-containing oxidoreductase family iron-sulfur binding subunit
MSQEPRRPQATGFQALREELAGRQGKQYWRGLEELARSPEFTQWLDDEFPNRSTLLQIDRRSILKFMGASMMLAGLTGCRSVILPRDVVVPYVKAPEEVVPGRPLFFASCLTHNGFAHGVLVESHMGRPTKIDGNPDHPGSLGACDPIVMASILTFYDPDRAQVALDDQRPTSWEMFLAAARRAIYGTPDPRLPRDAARLVEPRGAGMAVLAQPTRSPSALEMRARFRQRFPEAMWAEYDPVGDAPARGGAMLAFGQPVRAVYDLAQADVAVALDADFLTQSPGWLRMAREFMARRTPTGPRAENMNRLYSFESAPTSTGAVADHRWPVKPSEVELVARAISATLEGRPASPPASIPAEHFEAMMADLRAARGRALVIPGQFATAATHALCHEINDRLGATGRGVRHVPERTSQGRSLHELTQAMRAGDVRLLLSLGGNPAFDAPADLGFVEAAAKVPMVVHHGMHYDETTRIAAWHVPATHELEAWGDGESEEGTWSIQQPLIAPLYGQCRSELELLAALMNEPASGYDIVRSYWRRQVGEQAFEERWREWLANGVAGIPAPEAAPTLRAGVAEAAVAQPPPEPGIEVAFRPDPTIWDGRNANNGWLQEIPKPLTTLTWDNPVLLAPKTAERLGVRSEDRVEVATKAGTTTLPVWVMPGQPEDVATVFFGYGRRSAGYVGNGAGFDTYALRSSAHPWFEVGAKIRKARGTYPLAAAQTHHVMEGRDLVREATAAEFAENPTFRKPGPQPDYDISMFDTKDHVYEGPQWGMSVDLSACIGCGACVIGCQAENNIPVVGKVEVKRGREMHWIRIDRYYGPQAGAPSLDNPSTHFQPMTCMHCEKAPCEPVCPVAATVHSTEGLNLMVYNRCVGTRYCSNNCPYKVRRFNFFNYANRDDYPSWTPRKYAPTIRMLQNPDVTVRGRGVMEKCTFCIQRINQARIAAKKAFHAGKRERPEPKDGEIVMACQQACPTQAISFGNIADPESAVSRRKAQPRDYALLPELNTRNRLTYLAKIRNPNPEIERP